jgi:hypothetical protein
MAIPTKDEARAALGPYHRLIRGVVDDAWSEWRKVQDLRANAGIDPEIYDRTKSNSIFDAIARRGILRLAAEDAIRVEIESQTFKFFVKGIAARFKKGGDDKLGCNWPTQAALAFMEADGVLPGMPPETGKVEIIWLPNEIWTKIDRVLVVARDGDRLIWEYEIEAEAGGVIVALPSPTEPPDIDDLVKPKPQPTEETEER